MTKVAKRLLAEALELSEDERLQLAVELIASVDGRAEGSWNDAWLSELDRREAAAAARGTPAPEWSQARPCILERDGLPVLTGEPTGSLADAVEAHRKARIRAPRK